MALTATSTTPAPHCPTIRRSGNAIREPIAPPRAETASNPADNETAPVSRWNMPSVPTKASSKPAAIRP